MCVSYEEEDTCVAFEEARRGGNEGGSPQKGSGFRFQDSGFRV